MLCRDEFFNLKSDTPIEVQWKASSDSTQYSWWFAVVHTIDLDADEVTLRFEQYDSRSPEHDARQERCTIPRTGGGQLNGGVAGGIRKCSPRDMLAWKANLVRGVDMDWTYNVDSEAWVRVIHSARFEFTRSCMETGPLGMSCTRELAIVFKQKSRLRTYMVGGTAFQRTVFPQIFILVPSDGAKLMPNQNHTSHRNLRHLYLPIESYLNVRMARETGGHTT